MSVYLFISDIASYIGQNKFDPTKSFERLWKKVDKKNLETIYSVICEEITQIDNQIDELSTKRKTRQLLLQIQKLQHKKEHLQLSLDQFCFSQESFLKREFGNIISKLEEDLSIEEKKEEIKLHLERSNTTDTNKNLNNEMKNSFRESLFSHVNKTHGINKEESSLEKYEKKFGVVLDTSQKMFYKDFYKSKRGVSYVICGKMDGIDQSNKKIIEVKNRTNGFFNEIRDYEMTQMQLYMLLTNFAECELVEQYRDQIKISHIPRDSLIITQILDKLTSFIDRFEDFLEETIQTKREYILSSVDIKKKIIFTKMNRITSNCLL